MPVPSGEGPRPFCRPVPPAHVAEGARQCTPKLVSRSEPLKWGLGAWRWAGWWVRTCSPGEPPLLVGPRCCDDSAHSLGDHIFSKHEAQLMLGPLLTKVWGLALRPKVPWDLFVLSCEFIM